MSNISSSDGTGIDTPARTSGVTVRSALNGLKKFKESWISTMFLKGGISLSQVISLIVLLSLASRLPSPLYQDQSQSAPSIACPHPERYQAWMGVQIGRLLICWGNSVWICLRRRRRDMTHSPTDEARREEMHINDSLETNSSHASSDTTGRISNLNYDLSSNCRDMNHRGIDNTAEDVTDQSSGSHILRNGRPINRLTFALDRMAPFNSKALGLLAFTLFILGNILLFSPMPSKPLTCYHSAPMLWWGVMVVTGVGWFLLAQVLLVVVLVGLGSALMVAILSKIGIDTASAASVRSEPKPGPLSLAELHTLLYVCYVPSTPQVLIRVESLPHPALSLNEEQNTCGICQDCFKLPESGKEQFAEWLRQLRCGHVYHAKCIDEWLTKGSATCPFCNRPVRENLAPNDVESRRSTLVNTVEDMRSSVLSSWMRKHSR
ncbi:uncharacterized protein I206_105998 [Kwoniella pini CBS 10737]|uniref:RING-type E3 ubiquitin transferase n=1 Tax=Kwoniella pini CBS 10737 TaxID=1296096 RepID=A0A1B9I0U1_9TREE|nr:uncharacterized protein I206_04821 [Kwoniella pini CBS 10737]OCF49134.1 hypothetical protein I206_04821 [Kwoniella pini CBS 10737]